MSHVTELKHFGKCQNSRLNCVPEAEEENVCRGGQRILSKKVLSSEWDKPSDAIDITDQVEKM